MMRHALRLRNTGVPAAGTPRTLVRLLGNILWFLIAGLWLALGYVVAGILSCILIVTIPFGIASFKMAGLALFPLGKDIVPARYAQQVPPGAQVVAPQL